MSAAFDLLHPQVQRWLYDQRWTSLRPIQVDAIHCLLESADDAIISARTAGGKTEAAFLPIVSRLVDDFEGSVRALYVGPLRALINDQFRRMQLLCSDMGIPVHRWHGEVGQAARKSLLSQPAGILLITPESIEALFVRRSGQVGHLFKQLETVVIDELHVFPGTERGMHLRSLLHRLELARGSRIRRVGLSATLGDPDRYRRWLRPTKPDGVRLINHLREGGELKTRCHAYQASASAQAPAEDDESSATTPMDAQRALAADLLAHLGTEVNLVFANSKRVLEQTVMAVRAETAQRGLAEDLVLIHHGSLSREQRETAEQTLQEGGHHICFCSSTLELGVDIGSVRAVAHLDTPWSAASFAQRLGRSGRRPGEPAIFRQYHVLPDLTEEPEWSEARLRPTLIRGIALMDLYLEGWCESADVDQPHWSTLVHQIISVIAEQGGCRADQLHQRLIGGDAFPQVSFPEFAEVLRTLGRNDFIEQISDGTLLAGPAAERELADRGWYAAFSAVDEYEVMHETRRVGRLSIDNLFLIGGGFRLGGRGWEVEQIDEEKLRIYVHPSAKRNLPIFSGQAGIVHARVMEQMRMVLASSAVPRHLDPTSVAALESARDHFAKLQLNERSVIPTEHGVAIFPWAGTKVLDTLSWVAREQSLESQVRQVSITIDGTTAGDTTSLSHATGHVREIVEQALTKADEELICREKFDRAVPGARLRQALLEHRLDINGAEDVLRKLAERDAKT